MKPSEFESPQHFLDAIKGQLTAFNHSPQNHYIHLPPGSNWAMLKFLGSFTVEWNDAAFALRFEIQNQLDKPTVTRATVFGRRLTSKKAKCPNTARLTLTTENFDSALGYFCSPKLNQSQRNAVAPFFAHSDCLPYFQNGHFYLGTPEDSAFLTHLLTALNQVEEAKSSTAHNHYQSNSRPKPL